MHSTITVIILTFNEEKHIARCINSLKGIANEVFIVDSFSDDNTIAIAQELGAKVFQNPFVNHSIQFNWALKNCPINSEWVWRIDADEYIEKSESLNLNETLNKLPATVTGVYIKRKIIFLGKPLLHGGWYPVWHLKLWRRGKAFCENRWKDEHMVLKEGTSVKLDCIQIDENLNNLSWWSQKHNIYATRKMVDLLAGKYQIFEGNTVVPKYFGTDEQKNVG
ncbi:glycosyltransferase family 2 protein [Gillisia marina]|uniref:glycosyltransferase family 2 protein n=1 Tax=Gillisia marina TaxID=1167637 RepID=UPI00029AE127|nr:glycosyltransferase family 2 protein [Gillisia marina]